MGITIMGHMIDFGTVSSMGDGNKFRTDSFRLFEGFDGTYTVKGIRYHKDRQGKPTFRVEMAGKTHISLNGVMVGNAYLLKSEDIQDLQTVKKGISSISYFDDAKAILNGAARVHQSIEQGKGLALPDEITILGAFVSKDVKGTHPYIPLSRYPLYSLLLRHHQKFIPTADYISRDEIDAYLGSTDSRPAGIPENYKFQLPNHAKAVWDMANWTPTLIFKDWR